MYYKIENKECEVYRKLHELRTSELQMEKDNKQAIKDKSGLDFKHSLGNHGQQNICRVTVYAGIVPLEPEKVDPKIWVKHGDTDAFVPNKRTKSGREMAEFLRNGLSGSWFQEPCDILNVRTAGRFVFPVVNIANDVIYIYLDDKQKPTDQNVIEITSKEFEDAV